MANFLTIEQAKELDRLLSIAYRDDRLKASTGCIDDLSSALYYRVIHAE